MSEVQEAETIRPGPDPAELRARLLADLPVEERRIELAGVSTAVLEGGDGPPLVLLHDPAEYAAKWRWVIPDLVTSYRVVAPDLPGHGTSEVTDGSLTAERVLSWLDELIEHTCSEPPALVGLILGGGIAARFASSRGSRISRLVLVDSLGLAPLQPAPEFGLALEAYLGDPSEETHDELWRHCAFDLDRLRERMGETWEPFAAYNLDRARSPSVQAALHALMQEFAFQAIPAEDLAGIAVPTTLIWGRHDLATPLHVAEAVGARYGWPLHVIEDTADDPVVERPEAFVQALRAFLEGSGRRGAKASQVTAR